MDDPPVAAVEAPIPPGHPAPAEPRVLGRLSLGLAVLALAAYALGTVLLLVPVEVPQVQDCGAPAAFLLDGRIDVVPDPEGRIRNADGEVIQLPAATAEAARDRPCRERVAARAVPGLAVVAGATAVGTVAFALELFLVRPRRRRAQTGPVLPGSPPSPPPGGGPDWAP